MTNLTPQQWLQIKPSTRQALEKIFRIERSSFTHVVNNVVESDGHTYEDLKAVSLEEMRQLTHSPSENFFEQLELIIKMVEADGSTSPEAQPSPSGAENATPNVTSRESGVAENSDKGSGPESISGNTQEEKINEGPVLPVPGGVDEVNRGRDDVLPGAVEHVSAGVAAEDAKVDVKKPGSGKAAKQGK